ncbi:MAG: hypothetical protein HY836_14680 [Aquabacterium sp.]|uniref:hypothetical protein n=1 Tax=Aquabacterium sp. TaxID=1872578 RepID=UPI0025C0A380|nr:hypothetical protein [Aquabacterium sp.]MBI5926833.1 hypothetical protein [Aquabacterium sp.]
MRRLIQMAAATVVLCIGAQASAAEFNLFLSCTGKLSANGKAKSATLDLAMRDSNETALIQRSNVLPVGERLRYKASPMAYSMVYKLPQPGAHFYRDWMSGSWVVWQPNLKRLATIRISVDRQTGGLEGDLLDFNDDSLGTIAMDCQPARMEDMPEPKF